jgi:hypothetical protein
LPDDNGIGNTSPEAEDGVVAVPSATPSAVATAVVGAVVDEVELEAESEVEEVGAGICIFDKDSDAKKKLLGTDSWCSS